MNFKIITLAAALAAIVAAPSYALTKAEHSEATSLLSVDRKAALERCAPLAGNAKSLCKIEAKGEYDIARADLDAKYKPSAKANYNLRAERAHVAYSIAKARCGDLASGAKDVCLTDSKAAHVAALADAKVSKVSTEAKATDVKKVAEARKDAAEDKSDAMYASAKERCDLLTGDTKQTCHADAKVKFGR